MVSQRDARSGQRGQGLAEYALIILLLALVVITVLAIIGPMLGSIFSRIPPAL